MNTPPTIIFLARKPTCKERLKLSDLPYRVSRLQTYHTFTQPWYSFLFRGFMQVEERHACMSCGNTYPASRYAPHLQKCMNIGGRRRGNGGKKSGSPAPGSSKAGSKAGSPGLDSDVESKSIIVPLTT
jgi:hypothetical protein